MEFTLVETKKKSYLKLKNEKNEKNNIPITTSTFSTPTTNIIQNNSNYTKFTDKNEQKDTKILTQEEMKDILISKIKLLDNIDIKTKEINKEKGLFYAINIRVDLSKIGNGLFHSAKLNTVSHINRIVNMKIVFKDNENLHHDMKINTDALIQCFREIAPDTITSIHIETFKDQIDNEHLSLIVSTIKGSSLIYVYKRMIDFVTVINKKYGSLPSIISNNVSINDIADEMILENNKSEKIEKIENIENIENKENKEIIQNNINENVIEKLQDIKQHIEVVQEINKDIKQTILPKDTIKNTNTNIDNEIKDNKKIINNSILTVIENLVKEEKRLLLELENIRKLIKSQSNILETSQLQDKKYIVDEPIYIKKENIKENTKENNLDKTSFAYKVMHGSNY